MALRRRRWCGFYLFDPGYGVYAGDEERKDGPLRILPLMRFFVELTEGRLLR